MIVEDLNQPGHLLKELHDIADILIGKTRMDLCAQSLVEQIELFS